MSFRRWTSVSWEVNKKICSFCERNYGRGRKSIPVDFSWTVGKFFRIQGIQLGKWIFYFLPDFDQDAPTSCSGAEMLVNCKKRKCPGTAVKQCWVIGFKFRHQLFLILSEKVSLEEYYQIQANTDFFLKNYGFIMSGLSFFWNASIFERQFSSSIFRWLFFRKKWKSVLTNPRNREKFKTVEKFQLYI